MIVFFLVLCLTRPLPRDKSVIWKGFTPILSCRYGTLPDNLVHAMD